jgi:hypothetical protein
MLTPAIFLPGYAGSLLSVNVTNEAFLPAECQGFVSVGVSFLAFGDIHLDSEHPECIGKLLSLDVVNNQFDSPEGIAIRPINFGQCNGLAPTYWPICKTFESWGYTSSNFFAAPYDYRYMSPSGLNQTGFTKELQQLVEQTFRSNKKGVVLIGHSNGGPTMHSFLSSMTQSWKDKYILAMISLSGNFLGQMNMIKSFVYSDHPVSQSMVNTWEAQYSSFTWGGYNTDYSIKNPPTVVTTFANTPDELRYTSSYADILSLMSKATTEDWALRYQITFPSTNRSRAPMVDTYCYYGIQVRTDYSYTFSGDILESPYVSTSEMNGDGNQDIVDNTFCDVWEMELKQSDYIFISKSFPGVRHMQMYSDEQVMASIKATLDYYSTLHDL